MFGISDDWCVSRDEQGSQSLSLNDSRDDCASESCCKIFGSTVNTPEVRLDVVSRTSRGSLIIYLAGCHDGRLEVF